MPALLQDMGFHAVLLFMAFAAVAGVLAGAVLILRPAWLVQFGAYANRWVSTRKMDRSLERWVSLDKWFYQHHRGSGAVMLGGAVWLIGFVISLDRPTILAALFGGNHYPMQLAQAWLDAFVLASLTAGVFAALVSTILLLRPSMLRDFEQVANQWLSLRKTLKPVEIPRPGVDDYVLKHFRAIGALLLLGSLYTLAGLLLSVR
jgi:hypothetical protein